MTASFWTHALDRRTASLLAGAFFVLALVLQLPGNVPYDGIVVWHEAVTGALYAQHPAALVLLWRLCDAILSGPALFAALQLGVLWLAAGILLAQRRPPLWAGLLFAVVVLAWPPLLAGAGVTVKDVFGAHLGLLALVLARGQRPSHWFAAAAAGTLAFLLRYQFGLILPVLAIAWWPSANRRTGLAAVAGVVFMFAAVNGAVAATFVKTGPGDVMLSLRKMAIFDIAGTVAHDPSTRLTVFARQNIDTIRLKREMIAQYRPVRVDTLWQGGDAGGTITPTSGVFGRLYAVPDRMVLQQWRALAAERPGALLRHRIAAYAAVLGFGDIWQCRPITPGISWLPRPAARAVDAQSFAAPWSATLMTRAIFPVSLTFRAVLYLVLAVGALIAGPPPVRLMAGFALAYALSFFVLPQACEVRYAYPVMLLALIAAMETLQRRFV